MLITLFNLLSTIKALSSEATESVEELSNNINHEKEMFTIPKKTGLEEGEKEGKKEESSNITNPNIK